jgi:hypothetical protein
MNLFAFVRRLLGQEDAPSTALAVRAALPQASGLSRRQFLERVVAGAAGAAVASTLDYEQLLWLPSDRTVFLPSEWVENTFVTLDWVTREALQMLKNKLSLTSSFNRQYCDYFGDYGARIGDTVQLPLPTRFEPCPDHVFDPFARITADVLPVTLDQQWAVEFPASKLQQPYRSLAHARRALVKPIAEGLQFGIDKRELDVFASLPMPLQGSVLQAHEVHDAEIALRSIELRDYDVHHDVDYNVVRFDLLGGSSTRSKAARDRP